MNLEATSHKITNWNFCIVIFRWRSCSHIRVAGFPLHKSCRGRKHGNYFSLILAYLKITDRHYWHLTHVGSYPFSTFDWQ